MKVRFTTQAENDIIDSYLYGLTHFGQAQADQYEKDLQATISLLSDSPFLAVERPEYHPAVRIHHHNKHYIIYRLEDDYLLVIRVLRDEVDLDAQLHNPQE